MRDVVRDAWVPFNHDLEGVVNHLYADRLGLVSSGMGNLLDPVGMALGLPWRNVDGTLASREEIVRAWSRVKRDANPAAGGGTHARLTSIRLDKEDVTLLVNRKLTEVDRQLAKLFPSWESWPSDAQLFACSWAWAVGAGARYPRMIAALKRLDFEEAANECRITDGNGGEPGTLRLRNERNLVCLTNAARVVAADLDPAPLRYPAELLPEVIGEGGPPDEVA